MVGAWEQPAQHHFDVMLESLKTLLLIWAAKGKFWLVHDQVD